MICPACNQRMEPDMTYPMAYRCGCKFPPVITTSDTQNNGYLRVVEGSEVYTSFDQIIESLKIGIPVDQVIANIENTKKSYSITYGIIAK